MTRHHPVSARRTILLLLLALGWLWWMPVWSQEAPDADASPGSRDDVPASNRSADGPVSPDAGARGEEPGDDGRSSGAVTDRLRAERADAFNPYVITAHKRNYVLPLSYTTSINESVYAQTDVPLRSGLLPEEVKFQISLKTQLNEEDLMLRNDGLFIGLTIEAWWQLYTKDYSSPFRETNYQPELFYVKPRLWGPFGGSTTLVFGLEHQSNGQVQGLSRSWNRLYAGFVYERDDLVLSFRPWYRLPEKDKRFELDPKGDDNPDILRYMGYGEVFVGWRERTREWGLRTRFNPDSGKGAIDFSLTFPLFGKFRGYLSYFNGYGDSLIDYDHFQQRLGFGVALTNLF